MGKGALDGIKIADFSWMLAAPLITEYFAENGATVVRVESISAVDSLRIAPPRKSDSSLLGGWYGFFTCNKYSMAINLKHPKGSEVARRLINWADIVVDNFVAGRMEKWGLGYEDIKKIKPNIIMLEANIQGQTGPHAKQPGFGVMAVALAGIVNFTGWPDRTPVAPFAGYTDLILPRFGAAALLAAIDYRDRTGNGVYIDISQLETGLQFVAPLLLQYTTSGNEAQRMGNRCSYAVPHAAYRCKGEDSWCVISVYTDEEWQSLIAVMGNPQWAKEEKFSTFLNRKEHEDELDSLIEKWTVNFTAEEITARLQAAGIAAGKVQSPADILDDVHLKIRKHFWFENYGDLGMFHHNGPAYRLSKTPSEFRFHPPEIGEHTEYVCKEFLNMSDNEFIDYLTSGVFE